MIVSSVLLLVSLAGLISCTGFLVLLVFAALRFRRRLPADALNAELPGVSLLKPLCGLEANLEENLASFFAQDYPSFEIVFGARSHEDPAFGVARTLHRLYPRVPVKFVVAGEPSHPNAKVCSLQKMAAKAAHNLLVISDSDVRVTPDYVRQVVGPLLDDKIGLVTCLYRGVPSSGPWSRLEALGMSVEMTSGVLVADLLEGMKFALGPTMAIRRDVLESIGGLESLADYCADDFVLGNKVHDSGRAVVLCHYVLDHFARHGSCKQSLLHQLRWMKSTRFSRPKGHIGTLLTFAMPFGLLGLLAGWWAGDPLLGVGLFACAFLNRILMALVVGWGVVRDPRSWRHCWAYPIRDLLGFCLWCASYFGREITWRGLRYRLEWGGRMTCAVPPAPAEASAEVAVDHFA